MFLNEIRSHYNMFRSANGDGGIGGSRAPSLSGTPGRPTNDDRNELTKIMAKLNTITSQNTTHATMFESQKLQADEIQVQLGEQQIQLSELQNQISTLQEKQDRTISLLETLAANAARSTHPIQPYSRRVLDTSTHSTTLKVEHAKNAAIKPKRGRGRPRLRCTRCRQQKPFWEDSTVCEECFHLPVSLKVRKRRLSSNEGLAPNGAPWKQIRSGPLQDTPSRIADDTHDLDEDNDSVAVYSRPILQQGENTTDMPGREDISSELGSQDFPGEGVEVALKTPGDRQNTAETHTNPKKAAGRYLDPGPFFEGSGNVHSSYSDILDSDPPPVNEVSDPETSFSTHTTSIAESIFTDELDSDPYERQGELLHPSKNYQTGRIKEHRQMNLAPKANMAAKKPRVPVLNTEPDGSKHDSHHRIAQKTDGPSWRAVNRRF